jgi:hypothetical protein
MLVNTSKKDACIAKPSYDISGWVGTKCRILTR